MKDSDAAERSVEDVILVLKTAGAELESEGM